MSLTVNHRVMRLLDDARYWRVVEALASEYPAREASVRDAQRKKREALESAKTLHRSYLRLWLDAGKSVRSMFSKMGIRHADTK